MSLPPLPIDPLLPEIIAALKDHACLVLHAPPGAGKTTRVSPALVDAGLASDKSILLTQPRRLAARTAAARIAEERGAGLGGEVGYRVRFESRCSAQTRLIALTDGVLLRQLQDDPFLEDVGVVVFDEFHERSLNVDLALALVRRAQQEVRPDLKIVVMSATLDTGPVARFLGDCHVLSSAGRMYPVEVSYLRHPPSGPLETTVAAGVADVLARTSGHVLVFLPGVGEIRRAEGELAPLAERNDLALHRLHGELDLAEQQAALRPGPRRKVVLATNVAETSLTIEGVTAVVDSGLARRQQFDSALGINHLVLGRISRASAEQRAGRAGRTTQGVCLRLWTEREQQGLAPFDQPEILRVELSGAVLQLLDWGESDPARFAWFEPPPLEAIEHAQSLLERLGALGSRGLTPLGREMARLPAHPRLARLLLAGQEFGQAEGAALAAALLSERDLLPRPADRARPAEHWSASDVLDRMAIVEEFERRGRGAAGGIKTGAARFILRTRDQLLRLVPQRTKRQRSLSEDEAVRRALWAAFPDRLARRRAPGSRRAVMIGGRGVLLAAESAVMQAELFVCVDLQERGQSEALVRQASAVEREWLAPESLTTLTSLEFDAERQRVVALRRTMLEDLVIDEAPTNVPPGGEAAALLAREAAQRLEPTQWLGDDAQAFLARVELLRGAMPELGWPEFGESELPELLSELCAGCVSFDDLRGKSLLPVLQSRLDSRQLAALEREAPLRIRVPSGSQIAIEYTRGKPPVLAVKIQELYGLAQTPRIAGGRVPLLLNLLAPNMRLEQVTTDLASFWKNTYPQVRKDLKRRYPKHAWPDDPLAAQAEYAPGRRR